MTPTNPPTADDLLCELADAFQEIADTIESEQAGLAKSKQGAGDDF
jgi:hypothetical protein